MSPEQTSEKDNDLRIGADEWVAQAEARRQQRSGIATAWQSIPRGIRIAAITFLLIIAPFLSGADFFLEMFDITNNAFIVRIGAQFLAFAILAVGLNVVVGYAGLLDLGYIAFFGISGYAYAYLSSDFIGEGVHVPSIISVPLIIVFTGLVGWGLGTVAVRLRGDYLAIVTLGFGQLFIQLTTTLTRVELPGLDKPVDLTRGPNGINRLDEISIFGFEFKETWHYYLLFLLLLGVTILVISRINHSRIGRAWRAMREDELATEVMGMPTRQLKLLAFAIGAAVAALAGTIFAAWQGNVVPTPRYSVLTLITLYGMVILGGLGSIPGVVLGAFIFTALPEVLRNPVLAGLLFYAAVIIGLVVTLKPWRRFVIVVGGTIAAGVILKFLVMTLSPDFVSGTLPAEGAFINQWAQSWLVFPENFEVLGNFAIVAAIAMLLGVAATQTWYRWVFLGVAIYLAAFSWETRLAAEPAVTRLLVLGGSLLVLMITRPQGLLGKTRVSIT